MALTADEFGKRLVAIRDMHKGMVVMLDGLINDLYVEEHEVQRQPPQPSLRQFDIQTMGQMDPEEADEVIAKLLRDRMGQPDDPAA